MNASLSVWHSQRTVYAVSTRTTQYLSRRGYIIIYPIEQAAVVFVRYIEQEQL